MTKDRRSGKGKTSRIALKVRRLATLTETATGKVAGGSRRLSIVDDSHVPTEACTLTCPTVADATSKG